MKYLFLFSILIFFTGFEASLIAQEVKINHDGTDGLAIEEDGTIRADGEAACWRDELQELIGKKIYDTNGRVTYDVVNATIDFASSATRNNYVIMNIQLNHDWDETTPLKPHIHWEQNQNKTPNWLIAYRWQVNGQPKTEDWTELATVSNAFTYTSGTLIQISAFPDIPVPSTAHVSSIIQIKLMRDTDNDSGLFSENDAYSGDASGLSLDIHIRVDTFGSRTEYTK